MSDQDFPTFNDGRRAPRQPTINWWNVLVGGLPTSLIWLEDDIKASGYSVSHTVESTGEPLGGFSGASVRSGTVSIQVDDASAPIPLPGHVVSIIKGSVTNWYVVEEVSDPFKGKEAVRLTLTLRRIINPFFTQLLSPDEGDTFRITFSKGGGDKTYAGLPVNTRTGATIACALAPLGTTGSVPAGVTIGATTGIIAVTAATVAIGVYQLDVTCADTLLNKRTNTGGNQLWLTVTA
jgi:hypothetical protein